MRSISVSVWSAVPFAWFDMPTASAYLRHNFNSAGHRITLKGNSEVTLNGPCPRAFRHSVIDENRDGRVPASCTLQLLPCLTKLLGLLSSWLACLISCGVHVIT
jgi:hypothetical protein